ncbi:MAG TPA: enoyl-CoA hydratase-related protein [bacterium]|nr:enoyl-CoA hydratase-related protein [bacterium]
MTNAANTPEPAAPASAPIERVDGAKAVMAAGFGACAATETQADAPHRILEWPHLELRLEYPFAVLQLRRPDDKLNTMNRATVGMLDQALEWVYRDPNVKTLILTGRENLFTTGADVRGELAYLDQWEVRDLVRRGKVVFSKLEEMDCPTIAAINGLTLGGGLELALCCDFRIAVPQARLGLTEANLAMVPGWGGSQRLVRTVGKTEASRMIYAGEQVRAARALEIGLISAIAAGPETLLDECRTFAKDFANKSRITLGLAKREIHLALETSLYYGNMAESELIALSWTSEDRKTALQNFIEGRKGQTEWQNK